MPSLSDMFVRARFFTQRSVYFLTAILVLIATLNTKAAFALALPFLPDPALQTCLDEQAAANGWLNAEDVTIFNCVDQGVQLIPVVE